MSSVTLSRSRKLPKEGTVSTRKHRFETFNQRITKLRIDPIRRRRQSKIERESFSENSAFFTTSLSRWKDLNISSNFSNFIREITPLCQSLPQVIHFEEQIFDLLITYISKQDVYSLEPLLDLLSNFAHDVGIKFEVYFPRTVTLLTSIAVNHTEIAAIEWSFTCLTWLFKYLSRLLVPNLRPLLQIMAPLLGQETRKTHVTRFAAEALSFLVRRAAASYEKDFGPLNTVIEAIGEGLKESFEKTGVSGNREQYKQGLMSLLGNAAKGFNKSLHSYGIHIYRCLLDYVMRENAEGRSELQDVLHGTTIALIHHCDTEGLNPILNLILQRTQQLIPGGSRREVMTLANLLYLLSTVRQGSRIRNWHAMLEAGIVILRLSENLDQIQLAATFGTIAVILQSAPYDAVFPNFGAFIELLTDDHHEENFLPFCTCLNELGHDRFQNLMMPYLAEFIMLKWRTNFNPLLLTIPKLIGYRSQQRPSCPRDWQQHVLQLFRNLRDHQENAVECFHFLNIAEHMSDTSYFQSAVSEVLQCHIISSLRSCSTSVISNFVLGSALKAFVQHAECLDTILKNWWPLLCGAAERYRSLTPFLEAILVITQTQDIWSLEGDLSSLIKPLIDNLHSASHRHRWLSLDILKQICSSHSSQTSQALETALSIENSPLTLQSTRFISMQARKLASGYVSVVSDEILGEAIPHFCFGMLSFKLSQTCEDAVAALKIISETRRGESIVSTLCFDWLQKEALEKEHNGRREDEISGTMRGLSTEFECSNLNRINELVHNTRADISDAYEILRRKFWFINSTHHLEVEAAPTLALRVLAKIPHIAEKHSRKLVPIFLSWTTSENIDHDKRGFNGSMTLVRDEEIALSSPWKLPDRRSMLVLLGQFVHPQIMYKSNEVYAALIGLLCNGDPEIQRHALKAIFTWKLKEIQPYQESLLNLLDDTRFRDEITSLVCLCNQADSIQDDLHAVFMPVLIRLLYGRMIARSGKSHKQGQAARRKAVLGSLHHFNDVYIAELVQISLQEIGDVKLLNGMHSDQVRLVSSSSSARRRLGVLNMIECMIEEIGSRLQPLSNLIIEAILDVLICSRRQLAMERDPGPQHIEGKAQTSLLKAIRHKGMQVLNLTARCFAPEMLKPYLSLLFHEILSPRLEALAVETSQSVSGILQLFSAWASFPQSLHFLVDFDSRTLKSISDCLITSSSKEEVKLFVLDEILLKLITSLRDMEAEKSLNHLSHDTDRLSHRVFQLSGEHILQNLNFFLSSSPSKEALAASIRLVAGLAAFVEESPQICLLMEVAIFFLDQPSIRVGTQSKGELLHVLEYLLPLAKRTLQAEQQEKIYHNISSLFAFFRDRVHRLALGRSFQALASGDSELQRVSSLCQSLNAYSVHKIDEPDFDERLKAFNLINEKLYKQLNAKEWRPLLFNMVFYVKDDELALRSNASLALRRFIETASLAANEQELLEVARAVLLPSLRKGASEPSEVVRAEYLAIMAHLIRHFPKWLEVNDMHPLLIGNDEEASIFTNVLHIQHHRRLRALRRLASEARKGFLSSLNVAHFLIPLIEHFIFPELSDDSALNLRAEALVAIGQLVPSIKWPQFKALYRRYSSYIKSQRQPDKVIFKLLGILADALLEKKSNVENKDDKAQMPSTLASTMPTIQKLEDEMTDTLLPCLTIYLHDKDEFAVSLRVPVAVTVTKLLKLLPEDRIEDYLLPMLRDVCNILRSRAQESRDLARKTLVEILVVMGPAYFGFVLKQLRSSLSRGYQLHVLSFTVHSILVAMSEFSNSGDLDYAIPQITAVTIDDIFGATGQEKDAEEYISRMKEVKSSKSFGTIELVARVTTIEHLVHVIKPIQALLLEKLDFRMVKKIEELLKRIGAGLSRNEAIADQRILVFCHEVIQEAYSLPLTSHQIADDARHEERFLVRSERSVAKNSLPLQKHKLFCFALDTLRTVLHKYDALQTPANLYSFVPIIGDALTGRDEEIQVSALRLLTTIIKVPLKLIDDNAPIYVAECARIVKNTISMGTDLSQAALKLVSAILRERRTIKILDGDLGCLLNKTAPGLDEPDKQGPAFNLLKAIMNRKIIIPEVYTIMDAVTTIMVTNQSKNARDMARGAYIHFLMDYPQSEDRLSKQVSFLVRNLEYKYPEGRQSVMEAVHLLFTKVGDDIAQKILGEFFVPLVMVIINDESPNCRQMAAALIMTLFEQCNDNLMHSILDILRSWLKQAEQPLLTTVAFQCYSIYFGSGCAAFEREIPNFLRQLPQVLALKLKRPSDACWETIYFILQSFLKICELAPTAAFAGSSASLWASIRQCLTHPHASVKLSAAKLLGTYFADFAKCNLSKEVLCLPLSGSSCLWLTEVDILTCARSFLRILELEDVSEGLANQSVRNLVFLGKVMGQTSMFWSQQEPKKTSAKSDTSDEDISGEQCSGTPQHKLALSQLIYQSCKILRRPLNSTRASSLVRLEANLQLLTKLTNHMSLPNLRAVLSTMLLALHNFTDPSISAPFSADTDFNDRYKALASNAGTLMSDLQEKFGTTEYITVYHGVREKIKERRDSRKTKRAIERITDPETAEQRKRKKSEKKQGKRREKSDGERIRRRGW